MLPTGVSSVAPTGLTMPATAASSAISPTAATPVSGSPLTDFDVDLHYVKSGESFASIAKIHYGDERFGQALEMFNRRVGFDGRVVQIPPTHWIKKQTGGVTGRTPSPVPNTTVPTITSGPSTEWTGVSNANTYRFFELTAPRTFRELARDAYGSEQDWQKIFDLNPNYSSDAVLPAGTRIRLTGDAKIGR